MMRKELIVIGGGDFCWEILSWMNFGLECDWDFKGIIDTTGNLEEHENYLGPIESYQPQENDYFICSIGNVARLKICQDLEKKGANFINLIHPSAIINSHATIGKGCIIGPQALVSYKASIENYAIINASASVGHHAYVGEGCIVSSYVCLTGHVHLEQGVFISPHATVIPKRKIKKFSIIGPNSVVLRDIKETGTYFGVPVKRISA